MNFRGIRIYPIREAKAIEGDGPGAGTLSTLIVAPVPANGRPYQCRLSLELWLLNTVLSSVGILVPQHPLCTYDELRVGVVSSAFLGDQEALTGPLIRYANRSDPSSTWGLHPSVHAVTPPHGIL